MASVVMQAAEFPSVDLANRAEYALRKLCDAYVDFEANDPDPWNSKRIPPPLVEFGKRHGIDWPDDHDSQFLLKGMFEDAVELIRVDRMVFSGVVASTSVEKRFARSYAARARATLSNIAISSLSTPILTRAFLNSPSFWSTRTWEINSRSMRVTLSRPFIRSL